ncbi:MAG: aminotransferase class V-fold PLP-dependent enzyme [Peptoniphilus sp.]|uniref:aminotransferase class V-fold PLP-dependent enzyme n=1 Tax=Peptoniphilus sp. TaxID=1971214 RepID=UPI0025D8F8C1|nr:aminotransferase class V-fold PLP-dependent enzyme [Peptoniphilus sp.]MCI5643129.1 aminotransferase class V-fold PLP-dependent enzyme [Peptoniphilus sp.]MDY3902164.1 aminotransferase class V-fold PLP-dependent enzyme [Peptoniphilus sp.]
MIYLDNSSTTLIKPDVVSRTLYEAIASQKFSNPSRGFYQEAINSSEGVYDVREIIAEFFGVEDPLNIAFTANVTTSLNLVLNSLFKSGDHIITSVTEHNSVLRPLYQLEDRGVELSFIDIDENYNLKLKELENCLKDNTRAIVITAESNVSGVRTDLEYIYEFAIAHNLLVIIDGAQVAGTAKIKFNERKYPRLIFCITGHKALFGPTGTGAIIDLSEEKFKNVFTGGSGVNSFHRFNPVEMPDVFEYGTINFHSILALGAGVKFIDEIGIERVSKKIHALRQKLFYGIRDIPGIKLFSNEKDSSIVSFNYKDYPSSEICKRMYKINKIASRGGIHCAPLFHERVGTKTRGIVRLSLSYFNTEDEINKTIDTIKIIAETS